MSFVLFLRWILLIGLISEKGATSQDTLKGHRIVCLYNHMQYYKQNFAPSMIDPGMCTHINFEFTKLDEKKYEMVPGDPSIDLDAKLYEEIVALKAWNPDLKVMMSLGGWEDSTKKYSELVSMGARMDNFINKVIVFLKEKKFDGLDIAWEYPNCWQGAINVSPKDKENFAELLVRTRKKFDENNFLLSVSVGAVEREILAAYNVPLISKSVHHINVMTYDMHGPWEPATGHHTQLEKMKGDKDQSLNTRAAIATWEKLGADKMKLNIGLATYGKTFTLANPAEHGMNAPTKGPGRPGPVSKQSGFLCYHEICEFLNAGNWTEGEHAEAGFYAYSGDQWTCYDSPMMVVRKAKWCVEDGYGGILVKDLSCDDFKGKCMSLSYPLIKMIKMEIIHSLKRLEKAKAAEKSSAASNNGTAAPSGSAAHSEAHAESGAAS